jgi:hypothetical protein
MPTTMSATWLPSISAAIAQRLPSPRWMASTTSTNAPMTASTRSPPIGFQERPKSPAMAPIP